MWDLVYARHNVSMGTVSSLVFDWLYVVDTSTAKGRVLCVPWEGQNARGPIGPFQILCFFTLQTGCVLTILT